MFFSSDIENINKHCVFYVNLLLKSGNKDGWFEGTRFISLLKDAIVLPQGHETDLLHEMDRWSGPVFLQKPLKKDRLLHTQN